MEAALAILASPAGQALAGAAMSQVMALIGGQDPDTAAGDFAMAVMAYQTAVSEWEAAKKANPPSA